MIAIPIIVTIIVVLGAMLGICMFFANEFSDGSRGSATWWRDVLTYLRNIVLVVGAIIAFMLLVLGLIALWYWGTGYDMRYFLGGNPSSLG